MNEGPGAREQRSGAMEWGPRPGTGTSEHGLVTSDQSGGTSDYRPKLKSGMVAVRILDVWMPGENKGMESMETCLSTIRAKLG